MKRAVVAAASRRMDQTRDKASCHRNDAREQYRRKNLIDLHGIHGRKPLNKTEFAPDVAYFRTRTYVSNSLTKIIAPGAVANSASFRRAVLRLLSKDYVRLGGWSSAL